MIQLILGGGKLIWINPAHIVSITTREVNGVKSTYVEVSNSEEKYPVMEQPHEILAQIPEIKL